ncbi:MAG TPA: cache domain-containing protein [Treponemataceae bacterium]|nr:cache domain-containing protein [Treponemataceae bacterium]
MRRKVHIRSKIFFIVLIAVLPTVGITVFSALRSRESTLQEKLTFQSNLCEGFVNEQRLMVRNGHQMLLAISQTRSVKNGDYNSLSAYLADLSSLNPNYAVLLAADESGTVVASSIGKTGYSVADRPYVLDALGTERFTIGEFIVSKSTGQPAFPLALPCRNLKGERLVLIASFGLNNYDKELSTSRIPNDSILEIFDSSGLRLYRSDMHADRHSAPGKRVASELSSIARYTRALGTDVAVIEGVRDYVSCGSYEVNGKSIYVTVRTPADIMLSEMNRNSAMVISIMLLGCALAFGISMWLARRLFVNRIENLSAYIADIGAGNLSVRSDINKAKDEITDLMEAFNDMASALEQRNRQNQQVIAEKEELLRELQKRVSDNLQLLSSLVNLQIEYASEEPVRHSLMTTHSRIMALSLVYETIYRYSDIQQVSILRYSNGLCEFLLSLYADIGSGITFTVTGFDASLPIQKALPVALILNECVSNSILHAFPGNREGRISISFERVASSDLKVNVADNGIGMGDMGPFRDSLGYQMVESLVEQVYGSLTINSAESGTVVSLVFGER